MFSISIFLSPESRRIGGEGEKEEKGKTSGISCAPGFKSVKEVVAPADKEGVGGRGAGAGVSRAERKRERGTNCRLQEISWKYNSWF